MNRISNAPAVVPFGMTPMNARTEMQDVLDNDAVVLRARIHGCDVGTPVSSHERSSLRSKGLRKPLLPIDGTLCRVHTLTNAHSMSLRPHVGQAHAHVRLANSPLLKERVQIFHTCAQGYDEHFFVMPSRVIEAKILPRGPNAARSLSIPLEQRPVRSLARINCWEFLDAWHLIRLETASP